MVPLLVRGKINSVTSTFLEGHCKKGHKARIAGDDTLRTKKGVDGCSHVTNFENGPPGAVFGINDKLNLNVSVLIKKGVTPMNAVPNSDDNIARREGSDKNLFANVEERIGKKANGAERKVEGKNSVYLNSCPIVFVRNRLRSSKEPDNLNGALTLVPAPGGRCVKSVLSAH